jgi:hypothetical protein
MVHTLSETEACEVKNSNANRILEVAGRPQKELHLRQEDGALVNDVNDAEVEDNYYAKRKDRRKAPWYLYEIILIFAAVRSAPRLPYNPGSLREDPSSLGLHI